MHSVRKPWWQQATALVTVSTGGVITGFTFVPGAAASMTSPSSVPLHLLALEKAAKPADTGDDRLRPAIVNVAGYYLQLAQTRTPAQMEALIWGKDSVDGADHGPSCAAFASLTLELAAQAVGQQSWVSGGATYPWPLHEWADVRVNPNPDSLGVTSIVQDAQSHQRWHPLGDGYQPQPGDWVVFDGHVEVVTSSANGALDTIGADSLPNLTVNAHSFPDPLAQQGVEGFVDNGHLGETTAASSGAPAAAPAPATGAGTSRGTRSSAQPQLAAIPGVVAPAASSGTGPTGSSTAGAGAPGGAATGTGAPSAPAQSTSGGATAQAKADIPGAAVAAGLADAAPHPSGTGTATPPTHSRTSAPYRQHSRARRRDAGHEIAAGVHQPDRTGCARGPAALRRACVGHDRAGHRRVRVGNQPARRERLQPVRHQGQRARGQRHVPDARIRERPVGHDRRPVPRLPQCLREHLRPRGAPRHQRLLHACHGGPRGPRRLRERPDRRLRHRPRIRREPDRPDAAVQPVPVRLPHGEPGPGRGPEPHPGRAFTGRAPVRLGRIRGAAVDPRHPVGALTGARRHADAKRHPLADDPAVRHASLGSTAFRAAGINPGHPVGPCTGAGRYADAERHPDTDRAAVGHSDTGPAADRRPAVGHPAVDCPAIRVRAIRGTSLDPRDSVGPSTGAGRHADAERHPVTDRAADRLAGVRSAGHRAAIGRPAVGQPAVRDPAVGGSADRVAAVGRSGLGTAAVGGVARRPGGRRRFLA